MKNSPQRNLYQSESFTKSLAITFRVLKKYFPKISTKNKHNKKPLAMSFIPTAKGFVYNMDLLVAQPPVNHSLTRKPLDYKNNDSHATVIKLLSKDFLKCRKPA